MRKEIWGIPVGTTMSTETIAEKIFEGGQGPSAGDTSVTAESVKNALGYTPAKEDDVELIFGKIESKQPKGDYALKSEIPSMPSNTSQLTNDSGFITKTVNDLANYYLKSETYTRTEIDNKLSTIPKFSIQVVSSLPTSNISSTAVYLLKSGSESQNIYTEYIYVNNAWEYLGKQSVDLTGYALKTDVPTKLSALTNDAGFIAKTVSDLTNYYTKTETDNKYQPKGNYSVEDHTHSEYAKQSDVNQLSEQKVDQMDLEEIKVFITPQMFGAKGDGTTDDTTAIQNAFNHVATKGGYLFIPKGKYKVTSPITVDWSRDSATKRNFLQKIIGAGSQAFEKYYDNSVIVGYNIPAYRGVIELIGSGNTWGTETRIEDLGIECDEASCDPMSFALMYGDARNFKLSRVKLRGHNTVYARCGSKVDENGNSVTTTYEQINVKFEQCDFYTFTNNTKGFAFLPEGIVTGHYATMDNIFVDSCCISGVWVINSVNIMFQNTHVCISNVANKEITVNNVGLLNGYEVDYATGFYVGQAMSAVFQNCYFEDYRRGIQITPTLGNIRNISIMNCYLNPGCNQFNADGSRLCSDYGILINSGQSGKVVRNVLVQNNVFRFIEGDTEFVKANVRNEFANHFVFRDNCTTYTQEVPKVINTTTSDYDIQNGVEGSASVKSMTTSADGKALTIELTNGKSCTFNIGASAPVKGVDYWTETDKGEIVAEATAKVSQVKPLFANSKDECTDKTALYVLPDGMLYSYMKKESTGVGGWSNNLIPSSTDTDGSIFNGKGYKDSTRLNSSGVVTGQEHSATTGFISCKKGDKFQLTGCYFGHSGSNATVYGYIAMYDANKTKLMSASADNISTNPSTYYLGITPLPTKDRTVLSTDVTEIDLAIAPENVAFIRFSSATNAGNDYPVLDGSSMKVTKWVEGGTEVTESWESTGHAFVPANYESRIIELENLVADLLVRLR